MTQSRQPAGTSTGGEFAANTHDDASATLAEPTHDARGRRIGVLYEWDGEAMSPEDALQDWTENHEIDWSDLGFDSEEEAHEAVFENTRWDASALDNLDALHGALRYHGIPNEKIGLPEVAVDAYRFDGNTITGADLYSRLLQRGDISPAAGEMSMKDVVHQYNESNALSEGDDDYITTIYDAEEES